MKHQQKTSLANDPHSSKNFPKFVCFFAVQTEPRTFFKAETFAELKQAFFFLSC